MSNNINRVMVIGNLTNDPQLKYTPAGTPVVNFSIANNSSYTTKGGEKRDEVSYFNIVGWNKTAALCAEYLSKGKKVCVDGKLKQRRWQDGTTGNNRSSIDIVIDSIEFLTPVKNNE